MCYLWPKTVHLKQTRSPVLRQYLVITVANGSFDVIRTKS